MPRTTPPQPDELELSLFGPGVGECAIVHLGAGDWMIVDSCAHGPHKTPAALTYLESIGVDVSRQVKLVVITHWHDDHIRGVANLLRQADQARFACSAALRDTEFLTLVAGDRNVRLIENTSGVAEFSDALAILEGRPAAERRHGPHHWAAEGTCLFQREAPTSITVTALSPSSQTISDSHRSLADIIPQAGEPIRRFRHPKPNELSVALKVCSPNIQFLLGGDLETGASKQQGWRAVLASDTVPVGRAAVYKVAHHGSQNADLPELWETCLEENPYAMLTPYGKGRKPLPSDADVARIKANTGLLFCTTWPPTRRPSRREKAVTRTMKETVLNHWAVPEAMGHIRLRVRIDAPRSEIGVELFESAKKL